MDLTAVHNLVNAVARLNLRFRVLPTPPGWKRVYRALVEVRVQGVVCSVPVDDENHPTTRYPSPPVLLHLVLTALESIDESQSFAEWTSIEGSGPPEVMHEIYSKAVEAHAHLGPILAPLEPLSDWDWSMNTGLAEALKATAKSDPGR